MRGSSEKLLCAAVCLSLSLSLLCPEGDGWFNANNSLLNMSKYPSLYKWTFFYYYLWIIFFRKSEICSHFPLSHTHPLHPSHFHIRVVQLTVLIICKYIAFYVKNKINAWNHTDLYLHFHPHHTEFISNCSCCCCMLHTAAISLQVLTEMICSNWTD